MTLCRLVKREWAVRGRQRKLASLQLARDAKASRVEYANEPAATTSSSTIGPARMALSLSVSLISDISYVC